MEKKSLLIIVTSLFIYSAQAQLNNGGFPKSLMQSNVEALARQHVLDALTSEDIKELTEEKSFSAPYMVAKLKTANISFPESGTIIKQEDGSYIWRVALEIPNAAGIGLYFNQFQLPKGVELFVHNENKKHVLGAFTFENNSDDKIFAIEAVQGSTAFIELNIQASVNLESIEFNIENAAAYFRGVDYLRPYSDDADGLVTIDAYDDAVFGLASVCMINAVCPQSTGFEKPRAASLQTLYPSGMGVGMCSATMVNNTANTPTSCKQYVLTASHCDTSGSRSDAAFSNTLFRFDFQQPNCTWSTTVPSSKTITGARLIARSDYGSSMSASSIKGDFMLLEMRSTIPTSWEVPLNGWIKTPSILAYGATGKFIGFHHPHGDIKSLSTSKSIVSSSVGAAGTHWSTNINEGYVAQGSSGSSLFNNDGLSIGIASVAGVAAPIPSSCYVDRRGGFTDNIMNSINYSKLSYCWDNPGDIGGDEKKLGPWLDPTGSGVNSIETIKSDCSDAGISTSFVDLFNVNFIVYPNPSRDGKFQMNIKMNDAKDLKFEVVDITGKVILTEKLPNLLDQIVDVNLSAVPSGIYLIKLSNSFGSTTQKVVIEK